jgi:acetyltransferase (GNAT) family protein
MLDAKVRYAPTDSPNCLTFDSDMLLEKVQNASIAMLKAATAAMSIRKPGVGACTADLAGACVAFGGSDVPLTRAVGVGTSSAVDTEEIAAIEEFYDARKSPVRIAISGRTRNGVSNLLTNRGYKAGAILENWWRPLPGVTGRPTPENIEVKPATTDEAEVWVRTVAAGFQESDAPVDESQLPPRLLDTFYCFGFAEGAQPFLVRRNGELAGGGVLHINRETAHLRTTSCRFAHRRNGVQTALLSVRLELALKAGCRFVFSSTEGIGASARNLDRFGLKPLSISFLMSRPC